MRIPAQALRKAFIRYASLAATSRRCDFTSRLGRPFHKPRYSGRRGQTRMRFKFFSNRRPSVTGLSLSSATRKIARRAIPFHLRKMTSHGAPAFNLAQVNLTTPSGIVTTIPLKPTSRIVVVDPTFLAPDRKRLGRVHTKIIQRRLMPFGIKFRVLKPTRRKFATAIRHVFAAEHSKLEHLFRR